MHMRVPCVSTARESSPKHTAAARGVWHLHVMEKVALAAAPHSRDGAWPWVPGEVAGCVMMAHMLPAVAMARAMCHFPHCTMQGRMPTVAAVQPHSDTVTLGWLQQLA